MIGQLLHVLKFCTVAFLVATFYAPAAAAQRCLSTFETCVSQQPDCDQSCVALVPTCTTLSNLAPSSVTAQGYVCDCFFQGRCDAGERCCPACDDELVETLNCLADEVMADCTHPYSFNWCDTFTAAPESGAGDKFKGWACLALLSLAMVIIT